MKSTRDTQHLEKKETIEPKMNYGTTSTSNGSRLLSNDTDQKKSFNSPVLSKGWFLDSKLEAVMLLSIILNSMAAGIIFIFSNTIMPSLATFDPDVGIEVMNKINVIIVNPLFAFIFFGGLISAYPARVMWKNPDEFSKPARYYAVATTLIFFFGEVMVTLTQNIPRNNGLVVANPDSDDGVTFWNDDFLEGWVAWNTVRCVFSVIAAVCGILSLAFMRKPPAR